MASHNSFTGSFRCDVTTLAALYKTFSSRGIHIRSVSDLVRMSLDILHQHLETAASLSPVTDPAEAFSVLSDLRISSRNINKQNLTKQVQELALRQDGFSLDYLTRRTSKPEVGQQPSGVPTTSPVSDAQVLEIMESIRRRDQELAEQKHGLAKPPVDEMHEDH